MQTAAFSPRGYLFIVDLICGGNRADVIELLASVRREEDFVF
jgi:hypothetical protein